MWKAQGRTEQEWWEIKGEIGENSALREGSRATGRRTALSLLGALSELTVPAGKSDATRAGMCFDKEDQKTLGQLVMWLRRWRKGDLGRAQPHRRAGGHDAQTVWFWGEELWILGLDELGSEANESRAGGRIARANAEEKQALKFVKLDGGLEGDLDVQAQVEEWLEEHMTGDKAASTQKAYKSAWEKWCDWARRQGWMSPFLGTSGTNEEMVREQGPGLHWLSWLVGDFSGYVETGNLRHQGCAQESRSW